MPPHVWTYMERFDGLAFFFSFPVIRITPHYRLLKSKWVTRRRCLDYWLLWRQRKYHGGLYRAASLFFKISVLNIYWPLYWLHLASTFHGTDPTRSWKHSPETVLHIDVIASQSCCRVVSCMFRMWIFCSIGSEGCTTDCGGHLSTLNSLSWSRNQFGIIWVLRHVALSCRTYPLCS